MSDYTELDKKQDVHILHSMGYAQELERRMSSFSNFAISFSIICILSGGINSLGQATAGAGGAAIGIGWPLGCLISFIFALGLAQIGSAYPTAGGLYHWGSILGNRFTGWLSAWLNLLGLVTVLGAINVGTFYFFFGAFGPQFGIEDTLLHRVVFVAIITGLQAGINHFGIGLTAKLTDFSGYLIFATAILLTIVCLAAAQSWDISRLFTFANYTGTEGASLVWPVTVTTGMAFLLGLLLPVYTITGYDASAHTSEETLKAAVSVPRGMVSSVLWSALFGYLMLCAFVLMIPNMDDAAKQGWNVFFWAMESQVNPTIKSILYVLIFVAQFLCGLATVTSVSRMIFAFSRDKGLPASSTLSKVSPSFRTPVAAIWTGAILAVLFVWFTSAITIAGTPAYSIVVSCTVIFLFLSFVVPIALGLVSIGTAKWPTMGPWNMGVGLYRVVAVLAILSMALIFYIGIQPPNDWALEITVGFLVLTAIVWFAFENRRFKGPPIGDAIAKRQAEIAAAEAAVGEA
ncbi:MULTISPECIES: amino acid permease [Rhizobium]|uniref:amino acid permease n=1 Tax=Rhizobium TaxID=379 RepID=UPI0007E595D6|nr:MULTISPECIES: amino acid permease [Rhizobium]MBX4888547.1 amino acid permease [Rhizobium bangladeshense]MBX4896794.1 amino acid permease [Rhizobium bangladeshense]MBX4919174.1 amino acid permease [Rhizobium bangladeshense]MBY3611847.1 amino acid permease [Rhizobium bangladeshense]QSY93246.1 amino acid permease [Rhizobium bangladeshense]